jgi:hypothetical protein
MQGSTIGIGCKLYMAVLSGVGRAIVVLNIKCMVDGCCVHLMLLGTSYWCTVAQPPQLLQQSCWHMCCC